MRRPTYEKRDLYTSKRDPEKTHLQKIYMYMSKEILKTLHMSKDTLKRDLLILISTMHVHRKRRMYIKRDVSMWKEILKGGLLKHSSAPRAYVYRKRPMYVKRDLCMSKEMYVCQKRPMYVKRDVRMSKETYVYQKRRMYVKRDLCMSKETYVCQKRPMYIKRDVCMSKETYVYQKRRMYVKRDHKERSFKHSNGFCRLTSHKRDL